MVKIGKVVNTHGLTGNIKLLSNSDFLDSRLNHEDEKLFIHTKEKDYHVSIEHFHHHKNWIIIKFKEFNNVNEVEKFKDCFLYSTLSAHHYLEEDEYLNHDLLGCHIINSNPELDLNLAGKVIEVIDNPAHNLLRIEIDEQNNFLLPFKDEFIVDVDIEQQIITAFILKGMIDEN